MKARYINKEAWKILYNAMCYENALCLRLSLETGLRVGDCLKIAPSDLEGNRLSFIAEKTGKPGVKTISEDLARRLRQVSGDNYIFPGRLDAHKHRTRQAVYKDLIRVCKMYHVDVHVSPHSARKTYAVELYEREGMQKTMDELQHDRDFTTAIYAFSDVITQKEVIKTSLSEDEISEKIACRVFDRLKDFFAEGIDKTNST